VIGCTFTFIVRAQPAPASVDPHATLISAYLDGKWEDAEQMLKSKDLAGIVDPKQKADVAYVRQTLAESRPPWWKTCKAGNHVTFKPVVWGRTIDAVYEPGAKPNMKLRVSNLSTIVTLTWPAAEMDDPTPYEHGFTKGDTCNLNVWASLGAADAYSIVPISAQAQMDESGKLLVGLFGAFRGNLTGAYFGTPQARRWCVWLDLGAVGDTSDKAKEAWPRRAVASAFLAEVLSHKDKYPSIKLPDLPADGATEAKLAAGLKPWVEKHAWTFAEDRALRDTFKALSVANSKDVWRTGLVKLANGQTVALDGEKDSEFQAKRDAWVSGAVEKARGK
jgi:hypothetical protein